MSTIRTYRAGASIEDYCRACKADRIHTVVAADAQGQPIRVICGYCRSEHNFRGGPRSDSGAALSTPATSSDRHTPSSSSSPVRPPSPAAAKGAFATVSERERSAPPVSLPDQNVNDLELLLRRIIREEAGISQVVPADKWRGGSLVLRPATPGVQEKSWPIETFFHKVVMLRNRLRTLEQQVNASELGDDAKVRLQAYVTACYGSLTSFNVLFASDDDTFKGSGGE